LFKDRRVGAFSFQAWRLGHRGVDHTLLKQVIEQKANGGQVLPLGSDGTGMPL
jgi:hypothetical protein